MRIGINAKLPHTSPDEWAETLQRMGVRATSFPVDYTATDSLIDRYADAAAACDIRIAEVGIWNSPFHPDPSRAASARERCVHQLELAEYVRASCCVNVSGAVGDVWYGCYRENFSPRQYERVVQLAQQLCDTVRPRHTFFTFEPMQWMVPDTPEQYLQLLKDVDRPAFGVHLDPVNFVRDPYTYTHPGQVLARCFALLSPFIRSCHLKDCLLEPGTTVAIRETMPGTGVFPIRDYLQRVAALPENIPVLLEHLPDQAAYETALRTVSALMDTHENS
ncbi:MAG: sugar phosphate isomerase/epimerase family protein [Aristaeellaceae bacterium]